MLTRERWGRLPLDLVAPGTDAVRSRQILTIVDQDEFAARYPGLADVIRRLGMHTTMQIPLIKGDGSHRDRLPGVRPRAAAARRRARLPGDDRAHHRPGARSRPAVRVPEVGRIHPAAGHALAPSRCATADLNVAARYVPAVAELSVGGDWYDIVPLEGSRVAVAVGDIVGRGINAAAVMGQLRSAFERARTHHRVRGRSRRPAGPLRARNRRREGDHAPLRHRRLRRGHVAIYLGRSSARARHRRGRERALPRGRARLATRGRGSRSAATRSDRALSSRLHDPAVHGRLGGTPYGATRGRPGPTRPRRLDRARICPSNACATNCSTSSSGSDHSDDIALVALRMSCAARRLRSATACLRLRSSSRPCAMSSGSGWSRQNLPVDIRDDMLLAVGEACSNAVEHAYTGSERDTVVIEGFRSDEQLVFTVRDYGEWRPLVANPQRNRGLAAHRRGHRRCQRLERAGRRHARGDAEGDPRPSAALALRCDVATRHLLPSARSAALTASRGSAVSHPSATLVARDVSKSFGPRRRTRPRLAHRAAAQPYRRRRAQRHGKEHAPAHPRGTRRARQRFGRTHASGGNSRLPPAGARPAARRDAARASSRVAPESRTRTPRSTRPRKP